MRAQTIIVTGASGGIGLAIATKLAAAGASVIALSRSEGGLGKLQKEVADKATVEWRACDVTDRAQVEKVVAALRDEGASIDVLVNNAGLARGAPKTFWDQSLDDIGTVLTTNVMGIVNVTHAVLKAFLIPANKGTILDVSSVTGLEVPVKGMGEVSYHSSKAWLEGFGNALRNELLGTDIRLLTIRPGFVRTGFHRDRVGGDEQAFEDVFDGIEPLTADDVADAAVWMLSHPERLSIKALDLVPTPQRSLAQVDRQWTARRKA